MVHLIALGRYRKKQDRMEMIEDKMAEGNVKVRAQLDRMQGQS
jgi:hypothetical protein